MWHYGSSAESRSVCRFVTTQDNGSNGRMNDANFRAQAMKHHRKYLESLPKTSFPLNPQNHPAEVEEPQTVTGEPFSQR